MGQEDNMTKSDIRSRFESGTFGRFLAPLLALGLATPAWAETVTLKGSDTMVVLVQRWAEDFMKDHANTTLQVTGGGSGTGISALVNGTTDVCMSSRAMKSAEREKLRDKYASPGVEIPVARDGVSVYVEASNPVEALTLDQLRQIFMGKITNWKELGGSDLKIVVYSRENSSGTFAFFRDEVLKGGDFTPRAQTLPGTAAVVNAVSREKAGIGYGGAAYAKGVKIVKVRKDASASAVAPSAETIATGAYALSRPLYLYLRNSPSGAVKSFIDFALSPKGQDSVEKVGYYRLSTATAMSN